MGLGHHYVLDFKIEIINKVNKCHEAVFRSEHRAEACQSVICIHISKF